MSANTHTHRAHTYTHTHLLSHGQRTSAFSTNSSKSIPLGKEDNEILAYAVCPLPWRKTFSLLFSTIIMPLLCSRGRQYFFFPQTALYTDILKKLVFDKGKSMPMSQDEKPLGELSHISMQRC